MKTLVIGSGGREHAIAWKLASSDLVSHVYVAPGNGGTANEKSVSNVDIAVGDFAALTEFVKVNQIELTVVGPEQPLVDGIVDYFEAQGLACIGPNQKAAQLEGSKIFAKEFMKRHNIPTACAESFTSLKSALDYLAQVQMPVVIKADGLAAGKGVIIVENYSQGQATLEQMMSQGFFGGSGKSVLIESYLEGVELSYIVLSDGKNVVPLADSKDHKRIGEGDIGLNTGGMGAYSPVDFANEELHQKIMEQVVRPVIDGMAAEGGAYKGFLYVGLMVDSDGSFRVLEFNCRLGDPETQVILSRLKSDLVPLLMDLNSGSLSEDNIQWSSDIALAVVLASEGYPQSYPKGARIGFGETGGNQIFHAGTQLDERGNVCVSGGRILSVIGRGKTMVEARSSVYEAISNIVCENTYYRRDIGVLY